MKKLTKEEEEEEEEIEMLWVVGQPTHCKN
jgi:hypothetical protein